MDAAEFRPHVSSIQDGHDQTQLCFGLEGVSQGDDEPAVNSSQYPLLHHRPLQDGIRTSLYLLNIILQNEERKSRFASDIFMHFFGGGKIRIITRGLLSLKTQEGFFLNHLSQW